MQEFSNILRHRLGTRPEPQAHPDPDILTAYAEQVLTPVEREKILGHLSACAPCREVVALSLPVMQDEQIVLRPAKPRFWSVGIRWVAVAAMVIIAVTLAVQQPWKERRHTIMEPLATAVAPAKDTLDRKEQPAPAAEAQVPSSTEPRSQARTDQIASLQARASSPPETRPITGFASALRDAASLPKPEEHGRAAFSTRSSTKSDYVNTGRFVRGGGPGGPANATSANNAANYIENNANSGLASNGLINAPTPKTAPALAANDAFVPSRATPPISSAAIGSTAAGVTPDKSAPLAAAPPPPSAGLGNKTWRIITTIPRKLADAEKTEAASSPATASFSAGNVRFQPNRAGIASVREQQPLHWSISPEGKLIKSSDSQVQWHEAYPQDQDLQFRAVWTDSEGHEIWAGGSHLTLIHSWNGGVDWKKLKLGDTTGAADITAISIDDGKVQVKTSNNQTWVSQDGGVTWVPLKSNQPSQPEPK